MSEEACGRAGEAADTELKTKTPHVNVGNNHPVIIVFEAWRQKNSCLWRALTSGT